MTTVEERILKNQIEIMSTLSYLLSVVKPDLIGRGGELDRMRSDLFLAHGDTEIMIRSKSMFDRLNALAK